MQSAGRFTLLQRTCVISSPVLHQLATVPRGLRAAAVVAAASPRPRWSLQPRLAPCEPCGLRAWLATTDNNLGEISCPTRSGRKRPTRVVCSCDRGAGEFVPPSESAARLGVPGAPDASCLHRVVLGPDIGHGAREQSGRSPRQILDKMDRPSGRARRFHARIVFGVKTVVRWLALERPRSEKEPAN